MTPGLTAAGRLARPPRPGKWLGELAFWFEAAGDLVMEAAITPDAAGRATLSVTLHPAAGTLDISTDAAGTVHATACTATGGPGYHAYLCDLLAEVGDEFGITWHTRTDPTGYARTANFTALEVAFDRHLMVQARGWLAAGGPGWVGPPADVGFAHPGPVLTPFGPRSWDWVRTTALDPRAGRDLFAWRDREPTADIYRTRALSLLWTAFPWRAPLTDAEGALTDQIAADLAIAFDHAPALDYPWAAWAEVIAALDADAGAFTVQQPDPAVRRLVTRWADAAGPGRIGYRRYPVRVNLGNGWAVTVPGDFAEECTGGTWTGFDAGRRVTVGPAPLPAAAGWAWTKRGAVTAGGETLHYRLDSATDGAGWADAVARSLGRPAVTGGVRRAA